jgi:hypothetical protein
MSGEIEQRHVARLDAIENSCSLRLVSVRETFSAVETSKPRLRKVAAIVVASAVAFFSSGTLR